MVVTLRHLTQLHDIDLKGKSCFGESKSSVSEVPNTAAFVGFTSALCFISPALGLVCYVLSICFEAHALF